MKKWAVLGAGMVGSTIAIDLSADLNVTAFDKYHHHKKRFDNTKVEVVEWDLTNYNEYPKMLSAYDGFVCAVPGFMGFEVLKHLIPLGKSIVDISFFPEDARELHELAEKNQVPIIVDAGVAPGLSNMYAGYFNSIMEVTSFTCYVGGLPKERRLPFQYKAPFSPIDVIEEYTRPARIQRNGSVITLPALSEIEEINFPKLGTLEAFNTDGLRSLLHSLSHIPNMKEKTLRYPGHAQLMKSIRDAGFFNTEKITIGDQEIAPIDVSAKLLMDQWKLTSSDQEFTVMLMEVEGTKDGEPYQSSFYLYDETNPMYGGSSMSRTTGFTCTACVQLMMHQPQPAGIQFPEQLAARKGNFEFVLQHLRQRKVNIEITS